MHLELAAYAHRHNGIRYALKPVSLESREYNSVSRAHFNLAAARRIWTKYTQLRQDFLPTEWIPHTAWPIQKDTEIYLKKWDVIVDVMSVRTALIDTEKSGYFKSTWKQSERVDGPLPLTHTVLVIHV